MPRAALPWVDPVRVLAVVWALAVAGAGCTAVDANDPAVYWLKLSHRARPVHHRHAVTFVGWAQELEARSGGRPILDLYPAEQLGKLTLTWRTLLPALDTIRFGDTTSDQGIFFIWYWLPIVIGVAAAARTQVVRAARAFAAPGERDA